MTGPAWRLAELAGLLQRRGLLAAEPLLPQGPETDPMLRAVGHDLRLIHPGDLFVARPGRQSDGHAHVAAAVEAGAAAVVVERPMPGLAVPQVVVRDAMIALGIAAAWRAGDPSHVLGIVGITGTDGKTTTAYLTRAVLEAAGHRAGLIGTTDVIVGGTSLGNAARTSTPEAPELQAHLAAMLEAGDDWAVVESTSHGLAQQRVAGIAYDVAVLTNVTSEHLEFHGTREAYQEAKRSLFSRLARSDENPEKGHGKHAVVNADDALGASVAGTALAAGASVVRYGLVEGPIATPARPQTPGSPTQELEVVATMVSQTPGRLDIGIRSGDWSGRVALRLAGRFNVHNALAAMGVAIALGHDLDAAAAALGSVPSVPGRMEPIDEGQPFSVIVDYAHTAEALATVLDELAPVHPRGGLIAVFGSAGERDTAKRAEMGRVAGRRCRLVVLTDEDPRREDRMIILEAIAAGAEAAGKRRGIDLLLIPDRSEAIDVAIRGARPGDAVLLAGKGHEKTIETADGEHPWDEAAVAREALRSLATG